MNAPKSVRLPGGATFYDLLNVTDATLRKLAEQVDIPVEVFYGTYDEQWCQRVLRGV